MPPKTTKNRGGALIGIGAGLLLQTKVVKLTIGKRALGMIEIPLAFKEGVWFNVRKKFMSQHRSLRAIATSGGKRNVLKRFERVGVLKKRNQWKEGDRITGLRKTKPDA